MKVITKVQKKSSRKAMDNRSANRNNAKVALYTNFRVNQGKSALLGRIQAAETKRREEQKVKDEETAKAIAMYVQD